jgi:hypothetical protein
MFKLINILSGEVYNLREDIVQMGGPAQWAIEAGKAAWLEVPAGEDPSDCVLDNTVPALIVDPALKAARLAVIADQDNRKALAAALKARFETLDGQADLTAAEVKEMVRKLFKFIKAKGLLD